MDNVIWKKSYYFQIITCSQFIQPRKSGLHPVYTIQNLLIISSEFLAQSQWGCILENQNFSYRCVHKRSIHVKSVLMENAKTERVYQPVQQLTDQALALTSIFCIVLDKGYLNIYFPLFLHKNICCGYSTEVAREVLFRSTPNIIIHIYIFL